MFERWIAASDDLRSWEIIHFPTKIPLLAQNLAVSTKDTNQPSLFLLLYFKAGDSYTFAVLNHLMIIRYEFSFFFLRSILRKDLKRLLEQQTWLWRWVTECRMCVLVSKTTRSFGARKSQYHSGKWGNLFALIAGALLSTVCTLESVGTGWKSRKSNLDRRIAKKRKINGF